MIDILFVQEHDSSLIAVFLSDIFDCSVDRIKIFGIEEFNALDEQLDDNTFDCLCVISSVRGAVNQLLQLFKYKIDNSVVLKRITEVAFKSKVQCYLPSDFLDGYIFLGAVRFQ